jgi:hypothetical protein
LQCDFLKLRQQMQGVDGISPRLTVFAMKNGRRRERIFAGLTNAASRATDVDSPVLYQVPDI